MKSECSSAVSLQRQTTFNRIEEGDTKKKVFITSGVSYLYVKEAFSRGCGSQAWHVLAAAGKENYVSLAGMVDALYIVEELDPFLETHIKAMGIECHGKGRDSKSGRTQYRYCAPVH